METKVYDIAIIGGGAAGLFLASQLSASKKTVIIEAGERVGKKLLASGNGKCNLTNLDMKTIHYNKPSFVESFLDRFDAHDAIRAFEQLGLLTKVTDDRVYPYSECSSSVLEVLRGAIERNGTEVLCNHIVNYIEFFADQFNLSGIIKEKDKTSESFKILARNAVLASGSAATFGRDSVSLYTALGHTARQPQPSLVPIRTDKESLKGLSGVRVKAGVRIGYRYEVGEVLFKDFGVSGIAAFNMASELSRGIAKAGSTLTIDFMPEYSLSEVENILKRRGNIPVKDLLVGTFHSKVVERLLWASKCELDDLSAPKVSAIAKAIKTYPMTIEGLGDLSLAQCVSGGLNVKEFDDDLQSLRAKGAYAIGEVLDVDGDSGGFNLQWAWSSAAAVAAALKRN